MVLAVSSETFSGSCWFGCLLAQTQVPAALCSWLRSAIQQQAGHVGGGGAANGAPH